MSKKLTRKGVALATGLAFSLTGLTAISPATAAGDGDLATITPDDGKSMVGVLDHTFDVDINFELSDTYTSASVLKISNPTNAEIYFDNWDLNEIGGVYVMKGTSLVEANPNDSDMDYTYYDDTTLYLDLDGAGYSALEIGTSEEEGTVSLDLTAWGDLNFDGVIGDQEKLHGVATSTLKFVDPATLTPKPVLEIAGVDTYDDYDTGDDNGIYASVTFAQDVNVDYINEDDWKVTLDVNNQSVDPYDYYWDSNEATEVYDDLRADKYVWLQDGWSDYDYNGISYFLYNEVNCDDGCWSEPFVVGDKLSARVAYYNSADSEWVWKGSKSATFEIVKADLNDDADDVTGFEISADDSVHYYNADDSQHYLRAGTKSVTYTVQAKEGAADLAEAGIPVQIFIGWLDADSYDNDWDNSVKIEGALTSTNYGDDLESAIQTETNSDGQVEFTITTEDASVGVDYQFYVSYLDESGSDSQWNDGDTWDVEYEDAYADGVEANSYVLAGANPTVTFDVTDQFGEPVSTNDGKTLKVELRDSADSDLLKKSANVVNGSATFTFSNYVESGEMTTLDADVYTGASLTSANTLLSSESISLYNPAAAGSVALDEDELEGRVTYDAFVTGDEDDFADDVYAPNDNSNTISGVVKDVNGADLPAAVVTLSAKGLQFVESDDNIYAKDTITVVADENGEFSVDVWSHVYSEDGIEIKVTSGGKSATATLVTDWLSDDVVDGNWVENEAADSAADADEEAAANVVVTWNAPKHPAMNKTYIVTTVVTDTWGNVIDGADLDYEAAGALEVNGTDALTGKKSTNAAGKSTTYIRSIEDVDGYASLAVDVTDVDFGDIVLDDSDLDVNISLDLIVGTSGAAKAGKAAGVLKVTSWNSKGKTVKVYVAGSLVATRVASTSTYKFKLFGIKKGTKQVKVVVAGNSFFNAPVVIK